MKIVGYALIGLAVALGAAAAMAASWYLLAGGILDLSDARTLSSGIGRIDDWNREAVEKWGHGRVGLVKVFVLEPLVLVLIALAVRALVALGKALAAREARAAARAPIALAPALALPEYSFEAPPLAALVGEPEPVPVSGTLREPEPLAGYQPEPVSEAATLPEPEMVPEPELLAPPEPALEPAAGTGAPCIGDTLPLRTLDPAVAPLEVTLVELADPVGRAGASRYVAVRLQVRNCSSTLFEDLPTGGAVVAGDDGRLYRTAAQKAEPALREVRLAPGDQADGYLSFRLPADVRPSAFRYTPNLGLGPETGAWGL